MPPSDSFLLEMQRLYDAGQYLTAWRLGQNAPRWEEWPGTEGQILAGRLAANLGAPRLGRAIHWRAWRRDPNSAEAAYYVIWSRHLRRGALAALQFAEALPNSEFECAQSEAEFLALRGHLLGQLRDFEESNRLLDRALQLAPEHAWLYVERAYLLELEDRWEDALESTGQALQRTPFYRPAVQSRAHILINLNRDDEAESLLRDAAAALECGDIVTQLATFHLEVGRHEEARRGFESAAELYPLIDRDRETSDWYRGRCADAAYYCGDLETCRKLAKESKHPFYKRLSENLTEAQQPGPRVLLDLEFVRQRDVTCGPATLAAIARYWGSDIDHANIVESICYDGTPAHRERQWAEENGFATREFKVTWESAVALLDQGIPFTLTTVATESAHLQPVIGYDATRRVLLIRDPGERHYNEFLVDDLLREMAFAGPRGMALVPRSQADRLDAMQLPESDLYDELHNIQVALADHNRAAAAGGVESLKQREPEHRLTVHSEAIVAHYDADRLEMLRCAERMLELFPDDTNHRLMQVRLLGELDRRDELRETLESQCRRSDCDPALRRQYAILLSEDDRLRDAAHRMLRIAMRQSSPTVSDLILLSHFHQQSGDKRYALQLLRWAACLDDRDEEASQRYFIAAHAAGHADEAIAMLTDRFERFGSQSSWPTRTLAWAYDQLNDGTAVRDILERGRSLRPEDGELLLFAAEFLARTGNVEDAADMMAQANGKANRTEWLRANSLVLYVSQQLDEALACGLKVLAAEPIDIDMRERVAELLLDQKGPQAAIEHLRDATQQAPYHLDTRRLFVQHLIDGGCYEEAREELNEILRQSPAQSWAQRELAIQYLESEQLDEAIEAAHLGESIDPNDPASPYIVAQVQAAAGNVDATWDALRKAVILSVDWRPGLESLVDYAIDKAERLKQLEFIHQQLIEQPTQGDGLIAYQELASVSLPAGTLLDQLRSFLDSHPKTWQAWSALIRQMVFGGQSEDADQLSLQAVDRFPLLPNIRMDRAVVLRNQRRYEEEIEAIETAISVGPGWYELQRELAAAHIRLADFDSALGIYEKVLQWSGHDVLNVTGMAELRWNMDEQEEALELMARAIQLEPEFDAAADRLIDWSQRLERPTYARDIAEKLVDARPGRPLGWLMLAEARRAAADTIADQQEAIDRVLELAPRNISAHRLKATLLAEQSRFDEAKLACAPAAFHGRIPMELRLLAAEIDAQLGDFEVAVGQLEQILREDPDFEQGWMRMAEWYELQRNEEGLFESARQLIRIAPLSESAMQRHADALLRHGDRPGAIEQLDRALALYPDSPGTILHRFDLLLDESRIDEAEQLLKSSERYLSRDLQLSTRCQIATREGRLGVASRQLHDLCRYPGEVLESLQVAVNEMVESRQGKLAYEVLSQHVMSANSNAAVGTVWVNCAFQVGVPSHALQLLISSNPDRELWRLACAEFFNLCGTSGNIKAIRVLIDHCRGEIARHNETWSAAGIALTNAGQPQETLSWMEDWGTRSDLEPRHLFPLVLASWGSKNPASAVEPGRRALDLEPDGSVDMHRVWLAAERAISLRPGDAQNYLERVATHQLNGYYADVRRLVELAVQALRPEEPVSFGEWQTEFADFKSRVHPVTAQDPAFQFLGNRCQWAAAKRHGRWFSRLAANLRFWFRKST